MHISISCRMTVGVLLCGGFAVAQELVPNGGFERQAGDGLAGWVPGESIAKCIANTTAGAKASGSVRYIWDTNSHGDGKGSLRLEALDTYEKAFGIVSTGTGDDRIVLKPETEYRLTFWYRAQGLAPFDTQRHDCALVADVFFQHGGLFPQPGAKFLSNKRVYLARDAAEWQKSETIFTTPAGTDWGQVRLQLSSAIPNRKATVWFDDVSLQPTAAEAGAAARATPTNWTARTAVQTVSATHEDYSLAPPAIPYGSRIQRTMTLLASSTPEHRNTVRILFYGQSIIAQSWWKPIVADLKKRFPNAAIVAENPSIGGFMAPALKDTCESDLYPFYPDLLVFHDYGDKENMEVMFSNLCARTTAEALILTHHVAGQPAWMGMHDRESENLRALADKYGYEVVDVRPTWKQILEKNGVPPGFFLKDIIHLNPAGEQLMTSIVLPHFAYSPGQKPMWNAKVRRFDGHGAAMSDADAVKAAGVLLQKPLRLEFEGNRVDVVAAADGKSGTARIMIDGRKPSECSGVFAATRPSQAPSTWMPALRRVEIGKNPVVEDWTLTFTSMNTNATEFTYDVAGSLTGPDGSGSSREDFVSKSGRQIIRTNWFHIAETARTFKKVPPVGFKVTWKIVPHFLDEWKPGAITNSATTAVTLAQGLPNGKHVLEIVPNGDGPLAVKEMVMYRPLGR